LLRSLLHFLHSLLHSLQVWIISITFFESLNVATQAMAAGYLGRHTIIIHCKLAQHLHAETPPQRRMLLHSLHSLLLPLQVWIISITFFESLNVATQAMAAGFLGRHDRASAREVLQRALHLSCVIGLCLGLLLWASRGPLVGLFTKDAAVALLGGAVMPIIALCMPIDAGASIMDGGLIAAGQTNALSVIQVAGSLVQYAVLAILVSRGYDSVACVWGVLKVLSLARLGGGYWLHFVSQRSAYLPRVGVASQQQQQQQQEQQPGVQAAATSGSIDISSSSAGSSDSSSPGQDSSSHSSSSSNSSSSNGGGGSAGS
jgi:uncharacterized membrane protein YgcG